MMSASFFTSILTKKIHEKKSGTTLSPMVFTESRQVNDFPIRDHKVVLHVRRRRWLTAEGRNVILDRYSLLADNTSYSKEFADVLKKYLDTYPITALPRWGYTLR
ncbi:MAG: hypothetical protein L6V92_01870 [Phocaeicola vulgatus]|nr:MAG: hypothetical protein L6V92_01870 [Phocaeicola vulgatus]